MLGLVAVLGYLVYHNAQWREQARVARERAATTQLLLDSLTVRWVASADSAHRFRIRAAGDSTRAAEVAARLAVLRVRYDSVVRNPVTIADTVIVVQDSVIVEQAAEIRSLRLEGEALRSGAQLLGAQRVLLLGERDSLLALVRRAPVVQMTAPRPRSGWLVAGGLVVGFLVGVL